MIDGLKPYPAMKDSGVPWLGAVPEHWEVRPLRHLATLEGRKGTTSADTCDADTGVLNATPSELNGRIRGMRTRRYVEAARHQSFDIAPAGSTAICTIASVGQSSRFVRPFATNPQVRALVPREGVAGEFLFLLTLLLKPELQRIASTSVVPFVNGSDVTSLRVLAPPLPEQAAIVRFLDHADRRIRRYIRAKQKLIKLLEEQKQAIIHRAVTRGLDPNVRLKPSGVEWLGDVPEHWEVRRVKSLSLVKRGASPRPIADPKYFDDAGEYAWVRIADVSASTRYLETTTQRLSSLGDSLSVRLEPGALFLSIAGSVGKPIITKIKCCIHDGFVYFPQFHGNVEFLCRIFSCGAPFGRLGKLGTQLNLNTDTVGGICVGWPPITEQAAIVTYLDEATASFERVIASARREIDLLREYRTRLIADVVTGKLDVREAAVRLPDEVEEAEPLDEIDAEGDSDEAGSDDADAVPEEVEA